MFAKFRVEHQVLKSKTFFRFVFIAAVPSEMHCNKEMEDSAFEACLPSNSLHFKVSNSLDSLKGLE